MAWWIGQLHGIIKDPEPLFTVAYAYALYQSIALAADPNNKDIDTLELDILLVNEDYEALTSLAVGLLTLVKEHDADEVGKQLPTIMARFQEVIRNTAKEGEK